VVHQSSRYRLEPIVWLQQWALILVLYNADCRTLLTSLHVYWLKLANFKMYTNHEKHFFCAQNIPLYKKTLTLIVYDQYFLYNYSNWTNLCWFNDLFFYIPVQHQTDYRNSYQPIIIFIKMSNYFGGQINVNNLICINNICSLETGGNIQDGPS